MSSIGEKNAGTSQPSSPAETRAAADAGWMRLALDEARKGTPSPNPPVGAIITTRDRDGVERVVGRGHHARIGQAHAEVAAITDASKHGTSSLERATLYVTLEPCNHHGRTPPCTDAILRAGIERVVVGVRDPNPNVVGRGNERLRAAGIEVVVGVEQSACEALIAPFGKHARTGMPFVRLKVAASLDGRIAAAPHPSRPDAPRGVSKWVTSEASRRHVHVLRSRADAVLTGIGTALADDPALTPRDVPAIEGRRAPVRVVLDTHARLPATSVLATTSKQTPTWVIAGDSADAAAIASLASLGTHVIRVARNAAGHVDLAAALRTIGQQGIVDLLVEAGSALAGALIEGDFVDELCWFSAPIILGAAGLPALVGPQPIAPDVARRFRLESTERFGDDTLLTLRRVRP